MSLPHVFCTHCGTKNQPKSNYCFKCGKQLQKRVHSATDIIDLTDIIDIKGELENNVNNPNDVQPLSFAIAEFKKRRNFFERVRDKSNEDGDNGDNHENREHGAKKGSDSESEDTSKCNNNNSNNASISSRSDSDSILPPYHTRSVHRSRSSDSKSNAFLYVRNADGTTKKKGHWTQEEHNIFIKRVKECGIHSNWGLFSEPIPGRVGDSCSHYWKKLVETLKIAVDHNYYQAEKRMRFKWSKGANKELQRMKQYGFELLESDKAPHKQSAYKPSQFPENFEEERYKKYFNKKYRGFRSRNDDKHHVSDRRKTDLDIQNIAITKASSDYGYGKRGNISWQQWEIDCIETCYEAIKQNKWKQGQQANYIAHKLKERTIEEIKKHPNLKQAPWRTSSAVKNKMIKMQYFQQSINRKRKHKSSDVNEESQQHEPPHKKQKNNRQ